MNARLALALCAAAAGCSAHHERDDLVVGRDVPAAGAAASGPEKRGPGGGTGAMPPASAGNRALNAAIQNREGVALDVVTIGCAGTCFEVIAVARGGYPPYTYRWEDGSSDPVRTICPDATSEFAVVATDRGYSSDEFTRAPETVEAEITAEVLSCPDGGSPDAATMQPADAGVPDGGSSSTFKWEPLCIENGSFEDAALAPWRFCPLSDLPPNASINGNGNGFLNPEPIDGLLYLRMDPGPGRQAIISQRLCAPVRKGTGYYWALAMIHSVNSSPLVHLTFYLSKSECGLDGAVATYEPQDGWSVNCATWPALWDAEYLVIVATAQGGAPGTVFIDLLQPRPDLCPAP